MAADKTITVDADEWQAVQEELADLRVLVQAYRDAQSTQAAMLDGALAAADAIADEMDSALSDIDEITHDDGGAGSP